MYWVVFEVLRAIKARSKMAVFGYLFVCLSPINNICTFWSIEQLKERDMTSIVSSRRVAAQSGLSSQLWLVRMLGSGANISSVLCPQGHPSVHRKQCWILEKQFHFFHWELIVEVLNSGFWRQKWTEAWLTVNALSRAGLVTVRCIWPFNFWQK